MRLWPFSKKPEISVPQSFVSPDANTQERELMVAVVEHLSPFLTGKGFKEQVKTVDENSSYYLWRHKDKYFEVKTSTYPIDYPGILELRLGTGKPEAAEARWTSIALFELGKLQERSDFPTKDGWPLGDMGKWMKTFIDELEDLSGGFFTNTPSVFQAIVRKKNRNQQVLGFSVVSNGQETFYEDREDAEMKRRFS